MSRRSVERFARTARHARSAVFYGERGPDGVNNLEIDATKFFSTFVEQASSEELESDGFAPEADAIVTLPHDLGLTYAIGTLVTYLPSASVYEIAELKPRPEHGETRAALTLRNS